MSGLTDYHVHLPHYKEEEVPGVLERAKKAGVKAIVTLGMDLEESRQSVELAEKYDGVYAAVGVHPWKASAPVSEGNLRAFRELAAKKCVVAIGEVGIDQFGRGVVDDYVLDRGNAYPLEVHRTVLKQMMALARDARKALILHGRMSYRHLLEVVREEKVGSAGGPRGAVHDFTGEEELAMALLDQGLYMSVTGAVTWPDSESLRGIVRKIPLDRLLLETDSPARQPISRWNVQNEPAYVTDIVETLAQILRVSEEEIAKRTEENFHRFLTLG